MSPSEEASKVAALAAELHDGIERARRAGEIASVPPAGLTTLVSDAVKLYATAVEEAETGSDPIPVIDGTVSTTEAMVVACALLRAHHLNPFDLALWFSRTAPARGPGA
ncbi:MAG TPA: hypothetical protein VMB02_10880 [Candidatus Aquilonibacter sp.]|nr:hypothetical protein [Candidatus Aquilonibacter sp.]